MSRSGRSCFIKTVAESVFQLLSNIFLFIWNLFGAEVCGSLGVSCSGCRLGLVGHKLSSLRAGSVSCCTSVIRQSGLKVSGWMGGRSGPRALWESWSGMKIPGCPSAAAEESPRGGEGRVGAQEPQSSLGMEQCHHHGRGRQKNGSLLSGIGVGGEQATETLRCLQRLEELREASLGQGFGALMRKRRGPRSEPWGSWGSHWTGSWQPSQWEGVMNPERTTWVRGLEQDEAQRVPGTW